MSEWNKAGHILRAAGGGELYQRNKLLEGQLGMQQQQYAQRQQAAQQAQKATEEERRVKTAYIDAQQGLRMVKAGRYADIMELGQNRLRASSQFPGVDFSDTEKVVALSSAAANGDENAQKALQQKLEDDVSLGMAWGYLGAEGADSYQKGAQITVKDDAGNLFLATTRFNPNTGALAPILAPVGHDRNQVGGLQVVGTYGETAGERTGRVISEATGTSTAEAEVDMSWGPRIAAAKKEAVMSIENAFSQKDEKRSNAQVLEAYDIAMGGVATALGSTSTGPVAGWLPAITESQQIADGALATMAPVLKNIFRESGEGTFTKDDQEILMAMLPTRKDKPAARVAKLQMVDSVVRAKLGSPVARGSKPPYNAKGWPLMTDKYGNQAYVGRGGEVEEI